MEISVLSGEFNYRKQTDGQFVTKFPPMLDKCLPEKYKSTIFALGFEFVGRMLRRSVGYMYSDHKIHCSTGKF